MKICIPRDPQDRGPNRRTRHCLVGGRLLVTIFFLLLQDGLIIGKVFEVIRVDHLDGGAESAGELEGDRSLTEEVVDGVLVGFIVMIIMGCRLVPGLGGSIPQKSVIFALSLEASTYDSISSLSFCPFYMKNVWLYSEEPSEYNQT